MISHRAPDGYTKRQWMAHLANKADELEEHIRELKSQRAYADKREREEIDADIEKTEAILCGMHC
jgi:cell division protein FtsB